MGWDFFDEIQEAGDDLVYSLLWEAAYQHSQDHRDKHVLLFGASATLSTAMRDRLQEYNVAFITCGYKPYNVDMYQLQVPTTKDIYKAMESMCVRLLDRGHTVLVFLPGKAEIDAMKTTLILAKVNRCDIDILHSELSADKIARAKAP